MLQSLVPASRSFSPELTQVAVACFAMFRIFLHLLVFSTDLYHVYLISILAMLLIIYLSGTVL